MTIANIVTLSRLALTPLVVVLFLKGFNVYAAVVFAVAALTDLLDGYLARARGEVSTWGKVLDPVVDKVLTLTALGVLTVNGFAPLWLTFSLLLKEGALLLGGVFLLRQRRVISARNLGKAGSLFLFVALTAGLAGIWSLQLLLYIGAAFSLSAGIHYFYLAVTGKE